MGMKKGASSQLDVSFYSVDVVYVYWIFAGVQRVTHVSYHIAPLLLYGSLFRLDWISTLTLFRVGTSVRI